MKALGSSLVAGFFACIFQAVALTRYIIQLKGTAGSNETASLCSQLEAMDAPCSWIYSTVFTGFAATLDADQYAAMTNHTTVQSVDPDTTVYHQTANEPDLSPTTSPARTPATTAAAPFSTATHAAGPQSAATYTPAISGGADVALSSSTSSSTGAPYPKLQTQTQATWGLDRIDQASLPLDGKYDYTNDGTGVNTYQFGTGIRKTHHEFLYAPYMNMSGTRAIHGWSAFGAASDSDDCFGHGTHTAATAGGLTHGVAKNATMYAVRVLDCNGQGLSSGVIAGLDWLAQNAELPAVASLSLASPDTNLALEKALAAVIDLGITAVVPAGNLLQGASFVLLHNACGVTPANLTSAITVAASDKTDARWAHSNYGTCVDVYAPGVAVSSAYYSSDTALVQATGTSMACSHVTGVLALYLQGNPTATPAECASMITETAAVGKITGGDIQQTPNRLLQTYLDSAPSMSISPASLDPVVLFAGASFTAAASETRTITLANLGTIPVGFNVSVTPSGLIGAFVSALPSTGMVAPGQAVQVVLSYDIGQSTFQTVLTATVLITTSGRPASKVLTSAAYVFCKHLEAVPPEATHSTSIAFPLMQDTRPISADWPALAISKGDWIYFVAQIQFSHPVAYLATSAIEINDGAGVLEALNSTGADGDLCGGFTLRARAPFSPWKSLQTSVGVTLKGEQVKDVYDLSFPDYTNISTLDHRPVGQMTCPYAVYSGDQGFITDEQDVVVVLAFSEPVTGLRAESLEIAGPSGATISGLKLLRGTNTFYHFVVNLPGIYYDIVTVNLEGIVFDTAGKHNLAIQPLSFTRVAHPLLKGLGIGLSLSPGLLTLT